jgi:hypothetical protein
MHHACIMSHVRNPVCFFQHVCVVHIYGILIVRMVSNRVYKKYFTLHCID